MTRGAAIWPVLGGRMLRILVTIGLACAAAAADAQMAVSDDGQATYSIPISVPPGIAGHEPKLTLQYSRGMQGPLATGWSIGGVSLIARCGSTPATDGVQKGVRYTADDRFCLDGARLIQTSSSGDTVSGQGGYGAAGSEYRTEKDAFTRVRAYGGSQSIGPDYFRAWTKSGLVYEYGAVDSARIATFGLTTDVRNIWAVSKITDAAGNYISFEYGNGSNSFAGSFGREWMLQRVRYTGNGSQSPLNRLEFVYEDGRSDRSESYHEKSKTVVTKRLAYISSFIATASGDKEIGRIKLQHNLSNNSGRSLLASVQQCGGANLDKCAPAITFAYAAGPAPSFQQISLSSYALARKVPSLGYTSGPYQGDFDGDGRQDLLIWNDNAGSNQLLRSNGDGTFSSASLGGLQGVQIGHSNGCTYSTVSDLNGDGISDVLVIQDPERPSCGGTTRQSRAFLGTATAGFQQPITLSKDDGTALALMRVDPAIYCQMGQGDSGNCETQTPFGGRNYTMTDVNGDGLADIIFTRTPPFGMDSRPTNCGASESSCIYLGTSTIGRFTKISTNIGSKDLFSLGGVYAVPGLPGYQSDRLFVGDLNGDGLPDILVRDTGKLYVANGPAGDYQERQAASPCASGAEILDINGDGKWDVACMDATKSDPFRVYVNDGSGSFTYRADVSNWAGSCTQQEGETGSTPVNCDPWTRVQLNYVAMDIDGDGISDLMRAGQMYAPFTTFNAFLKGQPDGTFVPYSIPSLENEALNVSNRQFLIGDFRGRGALEILAYSDNDSENKLYVREDERPADLLVSITKAGNATTSIEYKPLSDPSVYTRGSGSVLPVTDAITPQWVVAAVAAPNGRGGSTTTGYSYAERRTDLSGRGSLGFKSTKKTAPSADGTPVTTYTIFSQAFPYAGLPVSTRQYPSAADDDAWFSLVDSEYKTVCATSASPAVYRVAPWRSTERKRDLQGASAPISYVTSTQDPWNCYGDPTVVTVVTKRDDNSSDSFTKVTANTFFPEQTSGDNWIIGRLASASQTNTVPAPAFAAPSTPNTPTPGNAPTLTVNVAPAIAIPGQGFSRSWSTTNATSVAVNCTAAAGGYTESASKSLNGSDTVVANSAWVGKPTTCVWTATGPWGSATVSKTLTTVLEPTISVQVSPNPLRANQSYQTTWTSANAASVSYSCSASGSGFNGSGSKAVSGSESAAAQLGWIGYPSSCTWTATGPGGHTKSYSYTMTTVTNPVISVSVPNPFVVGQTSTIYWDSAYATSVSYQCSGGGFVQSNTVGVNGSMALTAQPNWYQNTSTCVWTATGAGGSAQFTHYISTIYPQPTLSVSGPTDTTVGTSYLFSFSTSYASSVSATCTGSNGTKSISGVTSGSMSFSPTSDWGGSSGVGIWTCTWTASGPGGNASQSMGLIVRVPQSGGGDGGA